MLVEGLVEKVTRRPFVTSLLVFWLPGGAFILPLVWIVVVIRLVRLR